MKFREARLSDLEELMHWRKIVLEEVFDLGPDENIDEILEENRKYYQRNLSVNKESGQDMPGHIAVFCESDDGKNVYGVGGLCIYQEMPSPDNPSGWCAYLMNIYTRPEYRHMEIGRHTVSYLVKRAQNLKISKIYLETSEAGRHMYDKMGFVPMRDYLKLSEIESCLK